MLVHHDPWHDDAFLDRLSSEASDRWADLDGNGSVELGREGDAVELAATG